VTFGINSDIFISPLYQSINYSKDLFFFRYTIQQYNTINNTADT